MPKPVINNRIDYSSIGGIVNRVDTLLNQAVTSNSSPTFGNLCVSGDTLINGNLYVEGNTTVIDSLVSQFQDNIILLNNNELGSGVSLLQAGIEIDRGQLENYRIVYNETNKTFRVGPVSSTQPVALREDTPLNNGIMVWNSSGTYIQSVNQLNLDISINSTTNSLSSTSGSFWTKGGVGITKDLFINGLINLNGNSIQSDTTSSLNISSPQNINLSPSGLINIPNGIPLTFGSTNQSIQYNPGTNTLKIVSGANITFDFLNAVGRRISVPNQIPITFSTINEKVYTDSSNNMVVAGSQDIQLNPGASNKVVIPLNTPLAFYNANQSISANAGGDLSIGSGNNIFLNPSIYGGTVRIPTDNKLKFGGTGNQTFYADSNNDLNINASNNINITTNNVILSNNTVFRWEYQSISVNTNGHLLLNSGTSGSSIYISNTQDATNSTNGALFVSGGINIKKSIYAQTSLVLNTTSGCLNIANGNNGSVFNVKITSGNSSVVISAGDGTSTNPGVVIGSSTNTSKNLLALSSNTDTVGSFYIGRSNLNGSRNFNVNLPNYSDYSSTGVVPTFSITSNETQNELFSVESDSGNLNIYGALILHSTQDSISTTTGSFILYGGLGVDKNIYTNGGITSITNNTSALLINSTNGETGTSGTLFNIDTVTNNIDINANVFNVNKTFYVNRSGNIHIQSTIDSINVSTASLILDGGMSINKQLSVYSTSQFYDTINANNHFITNVLDPVNPSDAATKGYVDLIKQGLFVKDSAKAATIINGNLSSDFIAGSIIDNYTLVNGDRILIKNQTNTIQNGIYIVGSGTPIRSSDFSNGSNASGCFVFIEKGTINSNTGWICNTITSDIIGTDGITFTQFTGVGEIVPGIAISTSTSTNIIDVNIDNYSIEVDGSNTLRLSSNCIGNGIAGGSGDPLSTNTDQSHVTKLGNIISGTWSSDNIGVPYGGTGRTQFFKGNLIYGNNTAGLLSSNAFVFDEDNLRLGIGINEPTQNLHISSVDSTIVLVQADSDNANPTANPKIVLQAADINVGVFAISRQFEDLYTHNYPDSVIISNNVTNGGLTGNGGCIQLATNTHTRLTILPDGNIGINTSNPSSTLDVNGGITLSDELLSYGNINIQNSGASSFYFAGSGSIDGNLTVGNSGVVNILNTSTAVSSTSGGALNVAGGVSIGKNVMIGDSIIANGSGIFNNFNFSSTSGINYIQTPDNNNTLYSFQPIRLIKYNDYNNPITTFTETGIILNGDKSLNIGGNSNILGSSGYIFNFDTTLGNLHVTPNNTSITNGTFIIGTIGNLSNLQVLGGQSNMYWNADDDTLSLNDASLLLNNTINNPEYSFSIVPPNNFGDVIIGGTINNLNIVSPVLFSNISGANTISYTPSNTGGSGNFTIADDVITTFNGKSIFNNVITYGHNNQLTSLSSGNTSGGFSWNYLGTISKLQLDMYSNTFSLHFSASVDGGVLTANSSSSNGTGSVPVIQIYNDSTNNYHAFVKIPDGEILSLNIIVNNNPTSFNYTYEGAGIIPNGTESEFNNSTWTLVYNTASGNNASSSFGDISVNKLFIQNNVPIISYNNNITSKDVGFSLQRYQLSNDSSLGDVVQDSPEFILTLPSQTTMDMNQLKLTGGSAINDFYNNWWVEYTGQVRQIIAYNGPSEIATLDSNWTTKPQSGNIVNFYNNSYVTEYYSESDKAISFGYTCNGDGTNTNITTNNYIDIKTKDIYSHDITASGKVIISDSTDITHFTDGGSLTVLGGACISKTLMVGNKIGINDDETFFTPESSLHISNTITDAVVLLESNVNTGSASTISGIKFKNNTDDFTLNLNNTSGLLHLSSNNNTTKILSCNSSGNIGINTNTIYSPLTIAGGNLISSDSNDSYLGLNGGNSNYVNDNNGQIVVYGGNHTLNPGNVNVHLGSSSGSFNVYNTSGPSNKTNLLNIDNSGIVTIKNTNTSTYNSASLVLNGGLTIQCTENATSLTNGGALTIAGGLSVVKDFYIGGNLHIDGNFNASGSVTNPTITFTDHVNCNITSYDNSNLIKISTQGIFTMSVIITPLVTREYCQFQFTLPDKVSNFSNRTQCCVNVSGWTNDEIIIPLYNMIGVSVPGTKDIMVKFNSVNSDLHYIQINCNYTL
jgi:hypothetical protein